MKRNSYMIWMLALGLWALPASGVFAQVQMTVQTFNSLKPAKADVDAIDQGMADVRKQLDSKSSSKNIANDITILERKVENIRRDFKKYKRLEEWDASIAAYKTENQQLASDEKAAYEAKRKKDDAVSEVRSALSSTDISRNIERFRSNPVLSNGHSIADGYSLLAQRLEKFRASYPSETEDKTIQEANAAEAYVKGDFINKYMELVNIERRDTDKRIADTRQSDPNAAINTLQPRINRAIKTSAAFPGQPVFAENLKNDQALLQEIQSYKNDGGFEQYQADQVFLSPAKSSDAKIEGDVKKAMQDEGFQVATVRIQSSTWDIVSNEFGIPRYMVKDVEVGVRKEGKCFVVYGEYRREYAGAGTYLVDGYFRWSDPVRMNCNNLK